MKSRMCFCVLILAGLIAGPPAAGVPTRTIPFQAMLKSASGQPVLGDVPVTFRMYNAAIGGSPLWVESRTLAATGGLISTMLGEVKPLPLPFDGDRYISIQIRSDPELTPRVPLAAVPFALAMPGVTVNEDSGVGIGTANAFGLLDVVTQVPHASGETLDQQSPGEISSTQLAYGQTIWQPFRAGFTGNLTRIRLKLSGTNMWSFRIKIYAGTGLNGAELRAASIFNGIPGPQFVDYGLTPLPVTAGYPYTLSITPISTDPMYIYYDPYHSYLYGEAHIGTGTLTGAIYFKTYVDVTGSALNHTLLVARDRVGINTATPESALCIQEPGGNLLELRTGDSDPAWHVGKLSDGLYFNSPSGQSALALRDGPRIGINTSSPNVTLDIFSMDQGVIRMESRNAATGSVLELKNGTSTSDMLGAINFNNAAQTYPGQIAYLTSGAFTFRVAGSDRMRITGTGRVGIGLDTPTYPLDVQGDINARGSVRANGVALTSDARYKDHIAAIPDGLDTVLALRGVTFDWNRPAYPDKGFPAGRQIGFVAQEVEKVLPQVVQTAADGSKAVAYQNIVPVLVEAIKAQQKEIEEKDAALRAVQARLDRLERMIDPGRP